MPLKDVQKEVDKWAQQFKVPYWKPLEILARLTEETGELARELNHRFGPKQKKSSELDAGKTCVQLGDVKDVEDEIGDVIFTVACLANSLNIDLEKCFSKAMGKCYGRDNDRYEKAAKTSAYKAKE